MLLTLAFTSCGDPDPSKAPVINTPAGAKVDLSKVTMLVTNAQITLVGENKPHFISASGPSKGSP